jgi:hypothetical protein
MANGSLWQRLEMAMLKQEGVLHDSSDWISGSSNFRHIVSCKTMSNMTGKSRLTVRYLLQDSFTHEASEAHTKRRGNDRM